MSNKENINYIITLLFNTTSLIKEKLREQEKSNSLSILSVRTLRYVSEKGKPTMKDLADYLHITPPSTTSLIEHDVKVGLLERVIDKQDRRLVRLIITEKGKKVLGQSYKSLNKVMKSILSKLNVRQLNELKNILETLSRQFKK